MTNTELSDGQLRALRLVDCGTSMRLTHAGNVLVSRHAKKLLSLGLIGYAPERWVAYEPTLAGLGYLAAHPREALTAGDDTPLFT